MMRAEKITLTNFPFTFTQIFQHLASLHIPLPLCFCPEYIKKGLPICVGRFVPPSCFKLGVTRKTLGTRKKQGAAMYSIQYAYGDQISYNTYIVT